MLTICSSRKRLQSSVQVDEHGLLEYTAGQGNVGLGYGRGRPALDLVVHVGEKDKIVGGYGPGSFGLGQEASTDGEDGGNLEQQLKPTATETADIGRGNELLGVGFQLVAEQKLMADADVNRYHAQGSRVDVVFDEKVF